jgi:hypothetical protein
MADLRSDPRTTRSVFSGSALFSGAALVAHIRTGVSLPLALLFLGAVVAVAIRSVWRRANPATRLILRRLTLVGAVAGAIATLAYDVSKMLLSRLDRTTYNPFEAVRVFGVLLTGSRSPSLAYPAGMAFHLVNGTAFGIAFCILFGRRGVVAGIAWGLFLELFQLTLYPGWLDIRAYQEFVQISAFGHVVYGTVLGLMCRHWLTRNPPLRFARVASSGSSGSTEER